MEIKIATTKNDLLDHYLIRKEVFVIEQNISLEDEYDFIEKDCIIFLVMKDGKTVATSRLRFVKDYGKIERVCVLKDFRKLHIGKLLIDTMIAYCKEQNIKEIHLSAQEYAIGFYEKHGFKAYGNMYFDANIPHYDMKRESI